LCVYVDAFRSQERYLVRVWIKADPAVGIDYAMPRHVRAFDKTVQRPAYRARGPSVADDGGDLAIGSHLATRDHPDNLVDALKKAKTGRIA